MLQPRLDDPFHLTACLTESCNLHCIHCYTDCNRADRVPDLSPQEWRAVVDDALEAGVIKVFFEGGEPLLRPDFLPLLEHTARRALVYVRTNGTLVTEKVAAALKRCGAGTVCVDILGATAATHDTMTGVPGSFDLACAAVGHLLRADLPVIMTIIPNRKNVAELQAYLELAAALGVAKVSFLRLYPLGRAKRRWPELALTVQEMMSAIAALRKPPGLQLMHSWHPNDANCCWQSAAVRADGQSIGCPYLREYVDFGNVRETPFHETWNHPQHRSLRTTPIDPHCPDCSATQLSSGGCRAMAYAFTGRFDAPDPLCPKQNNGIDFRELPSRLLAEIPVDPGTPGT
ncbi:MAG: radical SAM protein [Acetobacteraceae bacterium]